MAARIFTFVVAVCGAGAAAAAFYSGRMNLMLYGSVWRENSLI